MKDMLKIFALSLPFIAIQSCSSPSSKSSLKQQQNPNSGKTIAKEFGERFSVKNIKQEREAYYAQKRLELRRISPADKVNQALRNNNIYLMEVSAGRGGSRSIPGLVEPKVLQVNCKTVAAEGMGDVLYGKNHILYRQEILQYMREFNALMSPYCK